MVDESGEDDDPAEEGEIRSAQPQEDDEVEILSDDDVERSAPPEENDDATPSPGRDDAKEIDRL
ncbi:hypothetical protein ANCDUO_22784 [Ancylostoma duodenale]|uniref:Uncharacterized protein n=1 Tax=Ancylostoma duodenale TaxID=51022 RepID=A0A0C2FEZ6_9BILA|nr:hypothetical protein ANCDUO_22784 [Ancylostoma duodenale]